MKLNKMLYVAGAILLSTSAVYAQSQADFTLKISRLGATQQEADQRLTDALGSFASSLSGSADIYQRNPDGSVVTANGKPVFDRAKVEKRLATYFDAAVDNADIAAKADARKAVAVATIEQEEKDAIKDRKPPVQDKVLAPGSVEVLKVAKVTPRKRPTTRRRKGQ